MSNEPPTAATERNARPKILADEYGNTHFFAGELARGGQGVVFFTRDADLAIKQPLDPVGEPDTNIDLRERFQRIRRLPLPPRIPVSLPLAILRDEPGYVMRLLSGMKPFGSFDYPGKAKARLKEEIESGAAAIPPWLAGVPNQDAALLFLHYARTGSTRRRLVALSKCAAILARLHLAGLVYGDVSPNNVFLDDADSPEVWLIDADNLRYELARGGNAVYTPGYGAPEVVQGFDSARPRTDCWAFAVMAFSMLALCNPFIGKMVLEPEDDGGGWDSDTGADGPQADPDEQARAGFFPFIDDENDRSNAPCGSAHPRDLVLTTELKRLFQETFAAGRTQAHRRPAMAFWARELAFAHFRSLICPDCTMSYYEDSHESCPYCKAERPGFLRVVTSRGKAVIPRQSTEFSLAHCLFHPFSLEHAYATEYEGTLDFKNGTVRPVRGTKAFPADVFFEFEEA